MAFKAPALCTDLTTTNGTGTYTLTDQAAPGAGLRTLADAVAAGFVSAGDTVHYMVVDTTQQGAALTFERGVGTVGAGGLTLARTTIKENHLGTQAAVSWPGGGSRTVRISLSPDDFALLASAQTFALLQTFTSGWSAAENSKLKKTGAVGALDVGSTVSATSTTLGRFGILGHSSTGVERVAAQWQAIWTDATNASEDALLRAVVMINGVGTVVAQIDSGGVKDGSGTAYALTTAVAGVLNGPSGGRLLWGTSTIPTGWSIVAGLADRMVMMTSTASEADDLGGSYTTGITASTTVDGHALVESELPSHSHSFVVDGFDANSASGGTVTGFEWHVSVNKLSEDYNSTTGATGGGGSHSHTASTSVNSSSYRPAYQKWAPIVKS